MKIKIFNFIKYLYYKNILTNKLILFGNSNYDYSFLKFIIMWILCSGKKEHIQCKKCLSCIFFLKKNHPDFIEIYSHELLKTEIDDIKKNEIIYNLTPKISRKKIILVYLTTDITENVINFMLKITKELNLNTIILFFSINNNVNELLLRRLYIINNYFYKYNFIYSINLIYFIYNISNEKYSINTNNFFYLIKKENNDLIINTLNLFFYKLIKFNYLSYNMKNKKINKFMKNSNLKLVKNILYSKKMNSNVNYILKYIFSFILNKK